MINAFNNFFTAPSRAKKLLREKTTFEAFLSAFPGEYCGFTSDESCIYSQNFCTILDLKTINSHSDIGSVLSPGNSVALEGFVNKLKHEKTPFTLIAASLDGKKHFKFSGSSSKNHGLDSFFILWVEDITGEINAQQDTLTQQERQTQEFANIQCAMDTLPRPVWLRDSDQKLIWVNRTYCDYLNKTSDVILGNQINITAGAAKRKDSDVVDIEKSLAKKAYDCGKTQEHEMHGIFHGKRLLLRLTETPLPEVNRTIGIAYNVTREEDLKTEFKRFETSNRELMEQLRSAIGIFDSTQHLSFYNAAFAQLWGIETVWLDKKPKLGDLMEKLREDRRLPEQADFRSFKQSWLDMFTNLINPREDMLHLPDGSALRMLAVPHSLGGLMMTFEDVTSRLALESSYNTLIAVQKETLDNLAEAVSVFGGDGRLKLCNPSYGVMWGLQPEDLDSEPHINRIIERKKKFFPEDKWQHNQNIIKAHVLGSNLTTQRLTCTDLNDKDKERLLDISAVQLPDGGVLVTYTDITSTVEIQNALREKAQALEAAEQLKLDFLANVSYQLRTPLSSIMGFTDILSNEYFGPLNERQKGYTSDIQDASNKLLDLVNNILDLATLEAGFMALERSDCDIQNMLQHVLDMVQDWARKGGINLSLDTPSDIGSINADKSRLQQAIINVIRNSIAFTPEGGEINLTAKQHKSNIHFIIKDTGSGIAAEDKTRIFEPFERAQGAKKERLSKSGAGIGLSLVRRITEAHDGRVELESEEDIGTTVTIIIPLTSTKTSFKIPTKNKSAD